MRTVLVTGSAGFIGYHVSRRLLLDGWRVIGVDALTDYYDVSLKHARLNELSSFDTFQNIAERIEKPGFLTTLLENERPECVIHLAAQAGVRYSIDAPRSYVESNLQGTFELLEAARAYPPEHLLMASTSSIYGANTEMPYAETAKADLQMSFYAATKKANEAMAHSYAHLYALPISMFRFFTVYGPWGRPDMALFKFTRAILKDQPIDVYNHGDMSRDFTYIDDLVEGIVRLIGKAPAGVATSTHDSLSPVAPYRVVNIGHGEPVQLLSFVKAIEAAIGKTAVLNMMDMQPGDVPATWADATLVSELVGRLPKTALETGVAAFVDWYRRYYDT